MKQPVHLFIKSMIADRFSILSGVMYREILGKLQRQEEIRIVRYCFGSGERGGDGFNRVCVWLHTLKTPVGHRTELTLLIDHIMYGIGKIG
ncbi:hypothetical protein D3C87_1989110 [compost metagenome]